MQTRYLVLIASIAMVAATPLVETAEPEETITFNDNGGWCWFQDERAVVHGDLLVIASVASDGGTDGSRRGGNIEATVYDLRNHRPLGTAVLHERLESDDHNVPAFLALPDGRLLAVYSRHGTDRWVRYRATRRPRNALDWEPERQIEREARVTYSNLFRLSTENDGKGRIYDFYRGEGWNPNFVLSDDDGETWTYGGRLVAFQGRPYVKYASNGRDTIHFITTEHHPHDHDNSIYHGFLRGGVVHRSDGTPIRRIRRLADGPIRPAEATRIFAGSEERVAWTVDLHLDDKERPYVGYSVQHDGNPEDLRYRYARWDGSRWHDQAIAHAGSALYPQEADYSGLLALHPHDPSTVYVSADVDPTTGEPLSSSADGKRHYEIFCGRTPDGGSTWKWSPVTQDSTEDNIRPIVPRWQRGGTILLWLRGTYRTYRDYDLDVVGRIEPADVERASSEAAGLLESLESPILLRGNDTTAYRDPAVLYHEGTFHLFTTMVETEPDGLVYLYTTVSTSRDLKRWAKPRKITPRDQNLNFSSPGNVIRFGDEWVLCLQTYPIPGLKRTDAVRWGSQDARIWILRSQDLETWSKAELLRVSGPDVARADMGRMIDAYLVEDLKERGKWWCFYKYQGCSFSWSRDLETWTYGGRVPSCGENVCVLHDRDEYLLFHSPANGIGRKRSPDLEQWRDVGSTTLGQEDWDWAETRLTAGFVLDLRSEPAIGKYLLFFHGGGPGESKTMGNTFANCSIGVAWSDDLKTWEWPGKEDR